MSQRFFGFRLVLILGAVIWGLTAQPALASHPPEWTHCGAGTVGLPGYFQGWWAGKGHGPALIQNEHWYWTAQNCDGWNKDFCYWHINVKKPDGTWDTHYSEDWLGWNSATQSKVARKENWVNGGSTAVRSLTYVCAQNERLNQSAGTENASIGISASATNPVQPSTEVCLQAVVSIPDSYTLSWSSSRGGSGSGTQVCGRYPQETTWTVTARNPSTQLNIAANHTILVKAPPPTTLSISPTSATLYRNQEQPFQYTVTPGSESVDWSASGTQVSASGNKATYKWSKLGGSEVVVVRVRSNPGIMASAFVNVINRPPTNVKISAPSPVCTNQDVIVTASATDPDGALDVIKYADWTSANRMSVGGSVGQTATYRFSAPGNFAIAVTARDYVVADGTPAGGSATGSATIVVNSCAPAGPVGPGISISPTWVNTYRNKLEPFTATTVPAGLPLTWSASAKVSSAGNSATYQWATLGNGYEVRVDTGKDGIPGFAKATVNVLNRNPSAVTVSAPGPFCVNQPILFSASATDPDGALDVIRYSDWSSAHRQSVEGAYGQAARYRFPSAGNYTVSVTARDYVAASGAAAGGSSSGSTTIGVVPCANNQPPTVTLDAVPLIVNRGEPSTLTLTATDPDPGDTLTTSWTADPDGSGLPILKIFSPAQRTYAWTNPGMYQVVVRVTDGKNVPVEKAVTITVVNQAPAVTINVPPPPLPREQPVLVEAIVTDPDAPYGDVPAAMTYVWEVREGGALGPVDPTATAVTVPGEPWKADITFGSPGAKTILAKVSDPVPAPYRKTTQVDKSVTVANRAPLVSLSVLTPGPYFRGTPVTLKAVVSDEVADLPGMSYSWEVLNDKGKKDPANDLPDGIGTDQVTIAWSGLDGIGAKTVRVTARDPHNATGSTTAGIVIANRLPTATVKLKDTPPFYTAEGVRAEVQNATDADGDTLTFVWRVLDVVGPGTMAEDTTAKIVPAADRKSATITFKKPGTKIIEVQVTDAVGGAATPAPRTEEFPVLGIEIVAKKPDSHKRGEWVTLTACTSRNVKRVFVDIGHLADTWLVRWGDPAENHEITNTNGWASLVTSGGSCPAGKKTWVYKVELPWTDGDPPDDWYPIIFTAYSDPVDNTDKKLDYNYLHIDGHLRIWTPLE